MNPNEIQNDSPSDELEFNILLVEEVIERMRKARLKTRDATKNLAEKINLLDEEMAELEKDLDKFADVTKNEDELGAIRTNPNQGII